MSGRFLRHPGHRMHLLFGANTDVGKSVVSAGLLRGASIAGAPSSGSLNYIKPLQCGGSDESFVSRHRGAPVRCQTLFSWDTPASPHLASRLEDKPVSDDQVSSALHSALRGIIDTHDSIDRHVSDESAESSPESSTIIETAGGVLSPSSSSPLNRPLSSSSASRWAWSTQADLYAPLNLPVVFVADGNLGGISVTLSSMEALWTRGYVIHAVIFIEGRDLLHYNAPKQATDGGLIGFGQSNSDALREYLSNSNITQRKQQTFSHLIPQTNIVCLPPLPPAHISLDQWYLDNDQIFLNLHHLLNRHWCLDSNPKIK